MKTAGCYSEYQYASTEASCASRYLWPVVLRQCRLAEASGSRLRVLDLGCGNGALADRLSKEGYDVTGVDLSESGIDQASRSFSSCRFRVASAYDDLRAALGEFDIVVSLEVVEHLYAPRHFARRAFESLRPGGGLLLSTPYHGYVKNLALALAGKMDFHYGPLWDGGHIKFWSPATITRLCSEAGFRVQGIHGVGRLPLVWKSMLVVARRPR